MPKHTADYMSEKLTSTFPAEKNAHARVLQWRLANGYARWSDYLALIGGKAELEGAFWAAYSSNRLPAGAMNHANWAVVSGLSGVSGNGSTIVTGTSNNAAFSAMAMTSAVAAPILGSTTYTFSVELATQPAGVYIDLKVNWFDVSSVFLSTSTVTSGTSGASGVYSTLSGQLASPPTARFAAIQVSSVVPVGQTYSARNAVVS